MRKIVVVDTFQECANNSFLVSKLVNFFKLNNFQIIEDVNKADDVIIVSCGFDKNRQRNSKKYIRDIYKLNENVIVTGCFPSMDELFFVEENIKFIKISELYKFNEIYNVQIGIEDIPNNSLHSSFNVGEYNYEKSFLIEISSGCSNKCSYCIIKKAKGKVSSKHIDTIIEEINVGIEKGFKIFTFLSDDCASYGEDINSSFAELLNAINKINFKDILFNLHYVFPGKLLEYFYTIDEEVFKKINYMNVPLQSGSETVLKLMNRDYNLNSIKRVIERIKEINPHIFISTHFLYGFTNETREDFYKTIECVNIFDKAYFFNYTSMYDSILPSLPYAEILYRTFILIKEKEKNFKVTFGVARDKIIRESAYYYASLLKKIELDYKSQNTDVLLIFPKASNDTTIGTPISLLSLCQPLIDEGLNVKILDERVDENFEETFRNIILNNDLLCVGFSLLSGMSLDNIFKAAKQIKEINSSVPIVVGGPYSTLFYEQVLKNDYIDYILRGEAEKTFLLFNKYLQGKIEIFNVPGLVYKQNGILLDNKIENFLPEPQDFAQIPYYLLYNYYSLYNMIFIQTSRGCPFNCTYCTIPILYGYAYRRIENEAIINLIEDALLLSNADIPFISIVDDNFFLNVTSSIMLGKLIAQKINNNEMKTFKWFAEIRVDTFNKFSNKDWELFKNIGLKSLFAGVESGSNFVLNKIDKKITRKDIIKYNKKLKKLNIEAQYSFVVGFPFETQKDFNDTINLMKRLKKNNPNTTIWRLNKFCPYPGTPIVKEYGHEVATIVKSNDLKFDWYSTEYDEFDFDKELF